MRVPDDVMIGGIDDVKYAELLRVRLTTVRQPFAAIGEAAYHAMLERIERPQRGAAPYHAGLRTRDSRLDAPRSENDSGSSEPCRRVSAATKPSSTEHILF